MVKVLCGSIGIALLTP
ncbi:hypothetical protein P3695_23835 [Vibrio parahaemolyticus]|nr:hypothetical protein [Vibrio parahaemolyticus]